jgi:hypothetical protein
MVDRRVVVRKGTDPERIVEALRESFPAARVLPDCVFVAQTSPDHVEHMADRAEELLRSHDLSAVLSVERVVGERPDEEPAAESWWRDSDPVEKVLFGLMFCALFAVAILCVFAMTPWWIAKAVVHRDPAKLRQAVIGPFAMLAVPLLLLRGQTDEQDPTR